jgi:hypothetical protein
MRWYLIRTIMDQELMGTLTSKWITLGNSLIEIHLIGKREIGKREDSLLGSVGGYFETTQEELRYMIHFYLW